MELICVDKIWDEAEHNAFTDLIYYKNYWYCTFREATGHMTFDGLARVLRSKDTKNWESCALINIDGKDIRDPKFSITPKNELMLNAGLRLSKAINGYKLESATWFSSDGFNWSNENFCDTSFGTWRWSTTWNNIAYSFAYTGKHPLGCLYNSLDGKNWKVLKDEVYLKEKEKGNESSLVFFNDTAYCLLRRDSGTFNAMIGVSKPPYISWDWTDLGLYIGGPKMLIINNEFYVAGRFCDDEKCHTEIAKLDIKTSKVKDRFILPSSGDSSYPGLVYKDEILYISYYSSHENKTSIYLAKVNLK